MFIRIMQATVLGICLFCSHKNVPKANASFFDNVIIDWVKGEDSKQVNTLSIVEISDLRVRDIKRRLTREHGYSPDELVKMIDKKELINALSYEEHRSSQKEKDRRKRVALRRSIIIALICVILTMFRPLFVHAGEVILVNVEVYTGR